MVNDFKVSDRPRILTSYFGLKRNKLLPLIKPSFRDEVHRHSFHNGGKVVILFIDLHKLIFLIVEDLSGCEFGIFSGEMFLGNKFYLLETMEMVIIKGILMYLHELFKFMKNVRSEGGV